MNPFLLNKSIDLVDFGDVKLFMFKDDNLYNIAVSEDRKNQSLADYQKSLQQNGYLKSPVTPENVSEISTARFGTYLFLHHLWERKIDFTVMDIGSHIGDFSIKIGNFIRTFGNANKVISFDPTEGGALVDYNIELNGLTAIVRHENLAIGDFDGLMMFSYSPGFSDSTHFAERDALPARQPGEGRMQRFMQMPLEQKLAAVQWKITSTIRKAVAKPDDYPPSYNFITRGVDILNYLEQHRINGNLFVKIDIEGFDHTVIERLLKLQPERLISIIFEFAPRAFGSADKASEYLEYLSRSFYLFDLFYSPNPTRFRQLDAANLAAFAENVSNRQYGYTDVFALDKNTPGSEQIAARLGALTETSDEMVL